MKTRTWWCVVVATTGVWSKAGAWPWGNSTKKAQAKSRRAFRKRLHRDFFKAAGLLATPVLKVVDAVVDAGLETDLGERLGDLLDSSNSVNKLSEFETEYDFLLNFVLGSASVQHEALTVSNISDPRINTTEAFLTSHKWPHVLFPGLTTRGFDPTHVGSDQMFLAENALMNRLFHTSAFEKVVHEFWTRVQNGGHGMTVEEQGTWVDGVSSRRYPRNPWKTSTSTTERYKAGVEIFREANQASIELRELVSWSGSDDPDDWEFSKFYFSGTGSVVLARVDAANGLIPPTHAEAATFVAPLEYLTDFAVKPGAGKYGGDVFFDDRGRVLHVYYDGARYSRDTTQPALWADVKRHCRGTVVMYVTLIHHLLGVHLLYSNTLAHAAPLLAPTHPIRALLWPHVFNAIGVNRKAAVSLSLPGGLFARGWALVDVTPLYHREAAENPLFNNWKPVDKRFEDLGLDFLPYVQDGLDFYACLRAYVQRYVDAHYQTDADVARDADLNGAFAAAFLEYAVNATGLPSSYTTRSSLVDVLASYIFYVTGYHTQVGSIHHDASRPDVAPPAWYDSEALSQQGAPPNAYFWATATFYFTADLRFPLVGDPCATEQRCGFKDKTDFQAPLPRDAAVHPPIKPIGYPDLFPDADSKQINLDFAQSLLDLQDRVVQRNRVRFNCPDSLIPAVCRPYNAFDINYIELSVGI